MNLKYIFFLALLSGFATTGLAQTEVEKLFHHLEAMEEKEQKTRYWQPKDQLNYFTIAENFYYERNFKQAKEYFEMALAEDPKLKMAYFYLFKILTIEDKEKEKSELIRFFLDKYPEFKKTAVFAERP